MRYDGGIMNYFEKSRKWFTYDDLDPELRTELELVWEKPEELEERFYKSLEFGTGGMRGELGVGTIVLTSIQFEKQ